MLLLRHPTVGSVVQLHVEEDYVHDVAELLVLYQCVHYMLNLFLLVLVGALR